MAVTYESLQSDIEQQKTQIETQRETIQTQRTIGERSIQSLKRVHPRTPPSQYFGVIQPQIEQIKGRFGELTQAEKELGVAEQKLIEQEQLLEKRKAEGYKVREKQGEIEFFKPAPTPKKPTSPYGNVQRTETHEGKTIAIHYDTGIIVYPQQHMIKIPGEPFQKLPSHPELQPVMIDRHTSVERHLVDWFRGKQEQERLGVIAKTETRILTEAEIDKLLAGKTQSEKLAWYKKTAEFGVEGEEKRPWSEIKKEHPDWKLTIKDGEPVIETPETIEQAKFETHKESLRKRITAGTPVERLQEFTRFVSSAFIKPLTVADIAARGVYGEGEKALDIWARQSFEFKEKDVPEIFVESYKPGGYGFFWTVGALFHVGIAGIGAAGVSAAGTKAGAVLAGYAKYAPLAIAGTFSATYGAELGLTAAREEVGAVPKGETLSKVFGGVAAISLIGAGGYLAGRPSMRFDRSLRRFITRTKEVQPFETTLVEKKIGKYEFYDITKKGVEPSKITGRMLTIKESFRPTGKPRIIIYGKPRGRVEIPKGYVQARDTLLNPDYFVKAEKPVMLTEYVKAKPGLFFRKFGPRIIEYPRPVVLGGLRAMVKGRIGPIEKVITPEKPPGGIPDYMKHVAARYQLYGKLPTKYYYRGIGRVHSILETIPSKPIQYFKSGIFKTERIFTQELGKYKFYDITKVGVKPSGVKGRMFRISETMKPTGEPKIFTIDKSFRYKTSIKGYDETLNTFIKSANKRSMRYIEYGKQVPRKLSIVEYPKEVKSTGIKITTPEKAPGGIPDYMKHVAARYQLYGKLPTKYYYRGIGRVHPILETFPQVEISTHGDINYLRQVNTEIGTYLEYTLSPLKGQKQFKIFELHYADASMMPETAIPRYLEGVGQIFKPEIPGYYKYSPKTGRIVGAKESLSFIKGKAVEPTYIGPQEAVDMFWGKVITKTGISTSVEQMVATGKLYIPSKLTIKGAVRATPISPKEFGKGYPSFEAPYKSSLVIENINRAWYEFQTQAKTPTSGIGTTKGMGRTYPEFGYKVKGYFRGYELEVTPYTVVGRFKVGEITGPVTGRGTIYDLTQAWKGGMVEGKDLLSVYKLLTTQKPAPISYTQVAAKQLVSSLKADIMPVTQKISGYLPAKSVMVSKATIPSAKQIIASMKTDIMPVTQKISSYLPTRGVVVSKGVQVVPKQVAMTQIQKPVVMYFPTLRQPTKQEMKIETKQIFRMDTETISRQIEKQLTKLIPREITKPVMRLEEKTISRQIEKQLTKPMTRQIERQIEKLIPKMEEKQITKQATKLLEKQMLKQTMKQQMKLMVQLIDIPPYFPTYTSPPPPYIVTPYSTTTYTPITFPPYIPQKQPPYIPRTPPPEEILQQPPPPPPVFIFPDTPYKMFGHTTGQGYNVYVKERTHFKGKKTKKGEMIRLGKQTLSMEDALTLGSHAVDNSAAATFNIKPVDRPPEKLSIRLAPFKQIRHKFRMKENKDMVENRSYRMDTRGEIKGISALAWLSKQKKIVVKKEKPTPLGKALTIAPPITPTIAPSIGYNIELTDEKGKAIKIDKNPLSLGNAEALMAMVIDNSIAVSGRAIPTNKEAKEPVIDLIPFDNISHKFNMKNGILIEKSRYRKDTRGEKKGINALEYYNMKSKKKVTSGAKAVRQVDMFDTGMDDMLINMDEIFKGAMGFGF